MEVSPKSILCKTHLMVLSILLYVNISTSSGLSSNFYSSSCPNVELVVKNTVRSASEFDPSIPGKLLRLLFHDCMVEGCDGSLLLEGNETERNDPANGSVDGFQVVESAKNLLEIFCPGTVSCADIVVLAARDAVELAGGRSVWVPMGRRDGRVSQASHVRANIIDTGFTIDEMMQIFTPKNLSLDDLVILSGAHTIGSSHCRSFADRFEEDANGEPVPADTSMDKHYAAELIMQCNATASDSVTVSNDPETSSQFDNQYFRNLLVGKGLLASDAALAEDPRTRAKVELFSRDQETFFEGWEKSFLKLASVGVKTRNEGEIRTSCMAVNG